MAKQRAQFSKLIVAFIIVSNVLFTIAVLWIFERTGKEPTTLIVSWFSFTGVEMLAIAGIKINEVKQRRQERREEWKM